MAAKSITKINLKTLIDSVPAQAVYKNSRFDKISVSKILVTKMMSKVLACEDEHFLLVTSLCSDQVLRTADIVGIEVVIITCGRKITDSIIELAKEFDIALLTAQNTSEEVKKILTEIQ